MGACDKGGYGHFQAGSRSGGVKRGPRQAHRVAYELTYGPLAPGKVVRHFVCDNPPCCNPTHLRSGTQADNSADKVAAGRQAKGTGNGNAKLTEADVVDVRRARAAGAMTIDLAARYGVSNSLISQVCNGRLWRHVPASPVGVGS